MTEPTIIKTCQVCIHLIANGEYNDGTDAAEKCSEGMIRIWGDAASRMCMAGCDEDCVNQHYDDHECESFEQGFSWSDCEGCGSEYGGDRYLVAVFEESAQ